VLHHRHRSQVDDAEEKVTKKDEENMAKRKFEDNFLKPEITQAGEYQIFKMKGKDARG
jgi:hypothetical protein